MRSIGVVRVVLLAGACACASGGGAEEGVVSGTLVGTSWTLIEVDGEALPAPEDGRPAELVFLEEDRFAGSAGCNRVLGAAKQHGASLSMLPGPMTMMACPPPLDRIEQRFVAVLGDVTGYRRSDATLDLLSGERVVMRLAAK